MVSLSLFFFFLKKIVFCMYLFISLVDAYLNFGILVFYEVFLVILVQEMIGKSGRILYLARKVIFPEFGAVKVLLINYKMQTRDSLIGLVLGCLPDRFSC